MRPVERRITENFRTLADIRERTENPKETLEQAFETFGDLRPVAEAIATAVNLKDWEGRISERNKVWAKSFTENGRKTYTESTETYLKTEGEYMEGVDRIHPAHLDQLADLVRKEWEDLPEYPSEWTLDQMNRWSDHKIEVLAEAIQADSPRSAWKKGVREYALDLITDNEALEKALSLKPSNPNKRSLIRLALLNGASSWHEYSWGGCSFIYDEDIALRLCTPSELNKTHNGQRDPNKWEQWLDIQARALNQAESVIFRTLRRLAWIDGGTFTSPRKGIEQNGRR